MSNGTLTGELLAIWDIFMHGSGAGYTPAYSAKATMAKAIMQIAEANDCDIHNMEQIAQFADHKGETK